MSRDLFVTSPLMKGADVVALQSRLLELGYFPGERDGQFGPATSGALRAFQRDHDLLDDGVCTSAVIRALELAKVLPRSRTPSRTALAALAEAEKHLGVKEDPPDSNENPFGKWFGLDGAPWCAIFVSYCFLEGAGTTIAESLQDKGTAGVHPKGCAYVPSVMAWLIVDGYWLGKTDPLPGDIVIYNWDGGRVDHIGIVHSVLGGGEFLAIEGNTSAKDLSNGGEVQKAKRSMKHVTGFGRLP